MWRRWRLGDAWGCFGSPPVIYWKCERFLCWKFVFWCPVYDEIKIQSKACTVSHVDVMPSPEVGSCEVIWVLHLHKKLHKDEKKNLLCGSRMSQWFHINCSTRATFLWSGNNGVLQSVPICPHMACRLCTRVFHVAGLQSEPHTYLKSWPGAACMASDHPAGTRLGCKMDNEDGVWVVSCLLLLLLLLCKRDTLLRAVCWHTHVHTLK